MNKMSHTILLLIVSVIALSGCASQQDEPEDKEGLLSRVMNSADKSPATADAPTPLMKAAAEGDLAELRDLIDDEANVNTLTPQGTALSEAIDNNQRISALFLMSVGADPKIGSTEGEPSLLMDVSAKADNRLVKALLAAGSDVNYVDASGNSAVAAASYKGHLTTVKILLKAGADVNVTPSGKSLLMHIVSNNDLLLAQVVISAGADVNFADESGNTALKIAQEKKLSDLEMLLVQSGAHS